jgi:DNA polymerase-1
MVQPAVNGTFHLPNLNAHYTAGSTATVADALNDLVVSGSDLACDIETFGLGPDARRIKCVSFATPDRAVVLNPREPDQARLIRSAMDRAPALTFHNSTFDVPNLHVNSLFDRDNCRKVTDTLLYARLAWPARTLPKTLEATAERLLGLVATETIERAFKRLGMSKAEGYKRVDIDSPVYIMGVAVDALVTARLVEPVRRAAYTTLTRGHPFNNFGITGDEAHRLVEREQIINRSTLRRACKGLRVDFDVLEAFRDTTRKERHAGEAELTAAGIRPGNAGDLIKVLEQAGALPHDHPRTPTGLASTVAKDLEALEATDPTGLAALYVQTKQIAKIEDDYLVKAVENADSDGWIHPTINLLAATTGRMSIGGTPLHQFPGAARGCVLADPGDRLTSLDWAQIEPVLIANVAGDLNALAGYENGTSDLYTDVAQFAALPRKRAKPVLLGTLYGEGITKLGRDIGVDLDSARAIRDRVFQPLPRTNALIGKIRSIGKEHRKIFTVSGRILTIPMGKGFPDRVTGKIRPPTVAVHKAVNYFVQGGAYDVLAEAMIKVIEAGLDDGMYLAMHDELVVSTEIASDVEKIMQTPPERLCLLARRRPVLRTDRADLGERWAAA